MLHKLACRLNTHIHKIVRNFKWGNECIWTRKRAVNKFPICVQCAGNVHRLGAKFGKTANVCFVFPDKELGVVLPGPLGATLAALLWPEQPRCVCVPYPELLLISG